MAQKRKLLQMSEDHLAIRVTNLTKQFGIRKAVDDVSFDLPQGAFLSIFGPNGAGKTTLMRMLSTLSRPSSGKIELDGIDALEEPQSIRAHLGFISHDPMLYPDLTAEENLILFGNLYGVLNPQAKAKELLGAVGLKHRRHDRVRTFSRGMTQRVSIARALMNDPTLVLMDEPYAGLDPYAVSVFDALIESFREGRTFCMVSHDFEKGSALASHIMILRAGRIVCYGEKGSFDEAELLSLYSNTVGKGVA